MPYDPTELRRLRLQQNGIDKMKILSDIFPGDVDKRYEPNTMTVAQLIKMLEQFNPEILVTFPSMVFSGSKGADEK